MSASKMHVADPIGADEVFATCFGQIETIGCVMRFWMCAPEQLGGARCLVTRAKILIPVTCVIPMARAAMEAAAGMDAFAKHIN